MSRIFLTLSTLLFLFFAAALPLFAQSETVTLNQGQVIDRDYFAGGDRVQVFGTVNGDAYVAGGVLMVDGTINGDLIAGGGNITISGEITGDVRAGGGNITFSGATVGGNVTAGGGNITLDNATTIQGSVVAGGGNIQIFAPIGKGATIGGGTVLLGNSVGGDIMAGVGELSLSPQASVDGNLTYWSDMRANIASGATVSGTVKQEMVPQEKRAGAPEEAGAALAGFFFGLKVFEIIWLTIAGLCFLYFLPFFSEKTQLYIREKFGWALLIGLLTVIVAPVLSLLLLFTIVGIPLALVLFLGFFILMWIGKIFAIYTLGRLVLKRPGNKKPQYISYLVGVAIYFVLSIIPIVNIIADILITLSGIGGLLATKRTSYLELRSKKIL